MGALWAYASMRWFFQTQITQKRGKDAVWGESLKIPNRRWDTFFKASVSILQYLPHKSADSPPTPNQNSPPYHPPKPWDANHISLPPCIGGMGKLPKADLPTTGYVIQKSLKQALLPQGIGIRQDPVAIGKVATMPIYGQNARSNSCEIFLIVPKLQVFPLAQDI